MKSKNIWRLIIFGGLLPLTACMQSMAEPMGVPLYQQGEQGCHTYRIPALAITNAGTLLAFCEGRKSSMSDSGDIGIVLRRSEDNGGSWNEQQVVWDDPGNSSGYGCVVVDRVSGTFWLLMTWNRGDDHEGDIIALRSKDTRRVFVSQSDDDGRTWSPAKEITSYVKQRTGLVRHRAGRWNTDPERTHKGRLIIPAIISKRKRIIITPMSFIPTIMVTPGGWAAVRHGPSMSAKWRSWPMDGCSTCGASRDKKYQMPLAMMGDDLETGL